MGSLEASRRSEPIHFVDPVAAFLWHAFRELDRPVAREPWRTLGQFATAITERRTIEDEIGRRPRPYPDLTNGDIETGSTWSYRAVNTGRADCRPSAPVRFRNTDSIRLRSRLLENAHLADGKREPYPRDVFFTALQLRTPSRR